jgi:hypothetical protein
MIPRKTRPLIVLLTALPLAANAQSPTPPAAAAATRTPLALEINARLRHEAVEDDAFARSADATTMRVRAGLRGTFDHGFSALLEGEGTAALGDDYNSGANRRTAYPSIGDPEAAEINQAWLGWKKGPFGTTVGRQRLVYDNQRWIGNVGWRQNEQTFDAVSMELAPVPGLTGRYAWLDRVHRVSTDRAVDPLARERELDTHLVNVAYAKGVHRVTGYAYLHEDLDVAAASTRTLGARYALDTVKQGQGWGLTLEAARQQEYAGNPADFSHAYWLVEPSVTLRGVTLRAGWELLGGDGRHALQTPLATLHAFNGWADKFVVTPAGGLEDRYLSAGGKFGQGARAGRFNWAVAWHDYRADTGGARYGREWNASFGFPVVGKVNGLVKYAGYEADAFARDASKWVLQFEWAR